MFSPNVEEISILLMIFAMSSISLILSLFLCSSRFFIISVDSSRLFLLSVTRYARGFLLCFLVS